MAIGQRYGTILVDLETHKPIALLPDRSGQSLAQWLVEHPGVQFISRDRSKSYRQGAFDGAPHAIQIADRFHLLQNLSDTLEAIFSRYSSELKQVELTLANPSLLSSDSSTLTPPIPPHSSNTSSRSSPYLREERLHRFQQVWLLKEQGFSQKAIAQLLGISTRTVQRFLRSHNRSQLDGWIQQALASPLSEMVSFARGVIDDYSAVLAGVTFTGHNGPVEGLINRLKMLKRQMFGRAGLELLSRPFLLTF